MYLNHKYLQPSNHIMYWYRIGNKVGSLVNPNRTLKIAMNIVLGAGVYRPLVSSLHRKDS